LSRRGRESIVSAFARPSLPRADCHRLGLPPSSAPSAPRYSCAITLPPRTSLARTSFCSRSTRTESCNRRTNSARESASTLGCSCFKLSMGGFHIAAPRAAHRPVDGEVPK
jgi:hypothetical protein